MRLKLLLILIFFTFSQRGDAQLEFSGEFRPRTEFRGGYKTPILGCPTWLW